MGESAKNTCVLVNYDRCSVNDGPGIRTVFFFKGCHLRCVWCHNPETYQFGIQSYVENGVTKHFGYLETYENMEAIILKDQRYYAPSGGGVTLSGGEALLQPEPALAIAKFCHQNCINLAVETSGYVPQETLLAILPYVDWWLYDYKITDKDDFLHYVHGRPEKIMENLDFLLANNAKVILRGPLIPHINDKLEHFKAIAALSHRVEKVDLLSYHDLGKYKAEKLKIKNYFVEDAPTDLQKEQWYKQLCELGCINLSIS